MKGKLFLIAAALCAVTGITSYARNAGDISIAEGVECYPFYDRVTVSSETERNIAVYTAVYGADEALKSVTKSEKKVQAETEFMNVYPKLEQGETFKTMIWDDKQTPLAAAITEIPEKKAASVTVHFTDEEGNVLKEPVKLDGEYYAGDKFTMPVDLTADFAVMTDDGKRNLYQFDESKSDMSAVLTENTELTLVFNMVTQYDYYEDFEGYTVNQSAWHLGKDSSLPTVENGTLHYASTGATAGAWTTFDEIDCTGKKVKIEADIKFAPTGTAGNSQFSIGNTLPSFDGGNISYGITGSGGNAAGHVIGLEYKEGKTFLVNGQNVDTGFIGDWMHIDAEADFVSKKVTIKITNAAGKSAEIKNVSFYSSCANNIGSMYVRAAKPNGTVEVDNVAAAIIGDGVAVDPDVKSPLNFKTVYAFGDSIVQGHNAPNNAFMNLLANKYSMYLTKYSKNGATVIKSSNDVITQVKNASADEPDFVVFDGYTNDAYDTVLDKIGTIQGADATAFDNSTFCGAFEEILYTMRQKWQNTKIVFVTIHKSGARDFDIQTQLHDLTVEMCDKWGVSVVDMFTDATLDTRDPEQMKKYIINGNGSHPNVACCEEFYVPMIAEKLVELCE